MAGNTILPKRERLTNRALDEDSAYVMNRLLQHVITGRTGATGANGAAGRQLKKDWAGWEVFAKTGTTQGEQRCLFRGRHPYYVAAAVWGIILKKRCCIYGKKNEERVEGRRRRRLSTNAPPPPDQPARYRKPGRSFLVEQG